MLSRCSRVVVFLGFMRLFVLIDMGIEFVHDIFELLINFGFFIVGSGFKGFRLDKYDRFDRVFFDRRIALSIK